MTFDLTPLTDDSYLVYEGRWMKEIAQIDKGPVKNGSEHDNQDRNVLHHLIYYIFINKCCCTRILKSLPQRTCGNLASVGLSPAGVVGRATSPPLGGG